MSNQMWHPKTCLCCKHLIAQVDPDYSDVTPGAGLMYICQFNNFPRVYMESEDISVVHERLLTAPTCGGFSAHKECIEMCKSTPHHTGEVEED